MFGWLNYMIFSNGDVFVFNDSVLDIVFVLGYLKVYVKWLNIYVKDLEQVFVFGYYMFRKQCYELCFDVVFVGLDYIFGYVYSDILSLVLYIYQQFFLVDLGIFIYEKNEWWQLECFISLYNMVQVGQVEQIEVWGGFWVVRCVWLKGLVFEVGVFFWCSYDGYVKIGIIYICFVCIMEEEIYIIDEVIGSFVVEWIVWWYFVLGLQFYINE